MIPGCRLKPETNQLYEIRKSCGRIMGVARYMSQRQPEGLSFTEYCFKPILWYTRHPQPYVTLRMNTRGCGSLVNLNFEPIDESLLTSGQYKGLVQQ